MQTFFLQCEEANDYLQRPGEQYVRGKGYWHRITWLITSSIWDFVTDCTKAKAMIWMTGMGELDTQITRKKGSEKIG